MHRLLRFLRSAALSASAKSKHMVGHRMQAVVPCSFCLQPIGYNGAKALSKSHARNLNNPQCLALHCHSWKGTRWQKPLRARQARTSTHSQSLEWHSSTITNALPYTDCSVTAGEVQQHRNPHYYNDTIVQFDKGARNIEAFTISLSLHNTHFNMISAFRPTGGVYAAHAHTHNHSNVTDGRLRMQFNLSGNFCFSRSSSHFSRLAS